MAKQSPYVEKFTESSGRVAELLGMKDWTTAYQSRSGSPSEPWLEPDVEEVIRESAGRGVQDIVLIPIGFLCDHMEVLFDLDVEAVEVAEEVGVNLLRAGTVGDQPEFIQMLAEKIQAKMKEG
jgi:ferrochelatase